MKKFPKIIAHRGMPHLARENTLPSFQQAIETGAEMIEFDVRRTTDGMLVVHHDPDVLCGHENLDICNLTYDELNIRTEYHIPTLKEVLSLCSGKIELDIELKEAGYEKEVLDIVMCYYKPESFIITSFHDEVIKAINGLKNGIRTGLLFWMKDDWDVLLGRMRECGAISLAPHFWLVTEEFMDHANGHNIPLYVWTPNKRQTMQKLARLGVAGIITDHSNLAIEIREEYWRRE